MTAKPELDRGPTVAPEEIRPTASPRRGLRCARANLHQGRGWLELKGCAREVG